MSSRDRLVLDPDFTAVHLDDAFGYGEPQDSAYALRNDLAHGDWWKFEPESGSISVRRDRDEDERFIEITVAEIEQAVEVFKDVEAELFKIRREIEGETRIDN